MLEEAAGAAGVPAARAIRFSEKALSDGADTLCLGRTGKPLSPGPGACYYGGTRPLSAAQHAPQAQQAPAPAPGRAGRDRAAAPRMETQPAIATATSRPSDGDLIRSAAGGDARAFHDLVDRHADNLFRLAVTLSRSRADAEDVLQEALVGAYRGLSRFDGRASVKTWLTQIVVRQSARMWNKTRRAARAVAIDSSGGAATGAAGTGPTLSRPSPEVHVDRRLDLMNAIDRLPDDHRQVILLREVQGLSYGEIAQALGVPQGTVESRLHRARAALKQRLKGYAP